MAERRDLVTFKGSPLTLVGDPPELGAKIGDATLLDNALNPVKLSSFAGKVLLIASVPSLDTPVCDTETRRFNQEAAALGDDVVVVTVSMDLPFAQARWCGAAGIDRVITLSDHKDAEFGTRSGLLIKELRLLARAVGVVDREGVLRYGELVSEMTNEPDYAAAIAAAKGLL